MFKKTNCKYLKKYFGVLVKIPQQSKKLTQQKNIA